jgi:hypothetical protein
MSLKTVFSLRAGISKKSPFVGIAYGSFFLTAMRLEVGDRSPISFCKSFTISVVYPGSIRSTLSFAGLLFYGVFLKLTIYLLKTADYKLVSTVS